MIFPYSNLGYLMRMVIDFYHCCIILIEASLPNAYAPERSIHQCVSTLVQDEL